MPVQLNFLEALERPTLDTLVKPDQIFDSEDWAFVTSLGEDTRFERKSARVQPADLAKSLSAFGNGPAVEGGVIAIGIENDGRLTGCLWIQEPKRQQLEYVGRDSCADARFKTRRLPIKNIHGEDDFIILVRVFYVEGRLVELSNGDAYCRESDRSRKLTDVEKQEIKINKGERAFELEPCNLKYPDDFRSDEILRIVKKIRDERGGTGDVDIEKLLVSMRMGELKSGFFHPNNVCALLFAKDPQLVFAGSYVHFLRFNGTEQKTAKEYNVIKDRIIGGTVLEIIRDTSAVLDANLREFTEFKGSKFRPIPEYPRDAWYEVIVNACVHRSYHARTEPIYVKMFDDHLIVESPGAFMPSITPDHFFHKPRNPFLMLVLREFGEVRCISEGTTRIIREIKDARLPAPVFVGTQTNVVVTLRNDIANRTNSIDSEAYKILGEALSFSLDPDERKIVNFAIENGQINVSDALRMLSTTYWHTAKAKLQRLVRRGILDFISTKTRDPNSYYKLCGANRTEKDRVEK